MRRILSLLLMIGVLCCGLHVGGPTLAHEPGGPEFSSSLPCDSGDHGDRSAPEHAGHHHHCPLVAEPSPRADATPVAPITTAPFPAPTSSLASRSHAPPSRPPLA